MNFDTLWKEVFSLYHQVPYHPDDRERFREFAKRVFEETLEFNDRDQEWREKVESAREDGYDDGYDDGFHDEKRDTLGKIIDAVEKV